MKTKLISLAVAAALVAPAAVMAEATLYGKLNMSIDYFDTDGGFDGWAVNRGSLGRGEGRANRIGVKGSEDLGNGLKAIYQVEFGVQMAEEQRTGPAASGANNTLSMRNSYVGLSSGFGTLLVGRHDTPMKLSTGRLDLFADTAADYNGTVGFVDLRVDNAVAYISPNFAGFQFAGAMHVGGGSSATLPIATEDADSLAEAYSLAITYKNGPFYVAAAYEELNNDILGPADNDLETDSKWRAGLGLLDWNGFTLAAVYENQDDLFGVSDADADLWQISAGYGFGNSMIKGFYGNNDNDLDLLDRESWGIGFDHNFSKRTKAYMLYTDVDYDGDDLDWSAFSLGMMHSF
jgi:predicted porin